ncbi:hypothetical protein H4582DRAFT_2101139 [Lactarius indigo]|nr:hypothetical protein H4582DRAFT_2101139 [Lactarius indigo]
MSRAPHEATNQPDAGFYSDTGDDQYPPQSTQNQTAHGVPNFVDGSGPIFSIWKADANGILIFTGLFSASIVSLISASIQDIRPNPQDTSNFYLTNIYHTVSDSNVSTSLPTGTSPPTLSPPSYAVWVNAFWFLSLVINLTCALLATLLQHEHGFERFAEGVEKFLLPWAVEALPTLLHASLFLFFAGLVPSTDVPHSRPSLQHEFCALWNQIVLKVQHENNGWMAAFILKPIRNVYVVLYQDIEAAPTRFSATTGNQDDVLRRPSSYPLCNIPGHHPDSTPQIHDDSASATFAHIASSVSIASLDAFSSSVPSPLHIVHDPTDVPSLNNVIYAPGSFHGARQTSIESLRILATPIDPAVAATSGIMMHHPTLEISTSTPPLSATSPPTAVSLEHNADIPIPSDAPNLGIYPTKRK